MTTLKIQSDREHLSRFLANFEKTLSECTYGFIFDDKTFKNMKQLEKQYISSYRVIKIFGIFEETLKDILQQKLDEKKIKKDVFKAESAALNFNAIRTFANSMSSLIAYDAIRDAIPLFENATEACHVWNKFIAPLYKDRNNVAHSSGQTYTDPVIFLTCFLAMVNVINALCDTQLETCKTTTIKVLEIKFTKEIFEENFVDNISLLSTSVFSHKNYSQ